MTPLQLDPSAKAPCTSTIVGLTPICSGRSSVAFTGNLQQCGNAAHVVPARDDAGTHAMTASHVAPRARPARTHARLRDMGLEALDGLSGQARQAPAGAVPCSGGRRAGCAPAFFAWVSAVTGTPREDRKSTRLNSSHVKISYAVFCLKK